MSRFISRLSIPTALAISLALVACGAKKKDDAEPIAESGGRAKAASSEKPSGSPSASTVANGTKPEPPPGSGSSRGSTLSAAKMFAAPATSSTLTLEKTTFASGDAINVKFSAALEPPAGQQYWITITKAGAPDSEYGDWHYVARGALSDALKAGPEGDYEIRLHDLYPKNPFKVMAREKISVKCEGSNCGAPPTPPTAPPPPEQPKANSDGFLADGWPAEIPPRGSKPPTIDEWNAMTKEVTVWHSSELRCETKMVREWLRVSCHKNAYGQPTDVTKGANEGQQAFVFHSSEVASLVVEVLPGKSFEAEFSWEDAIFEFSLAWPNGGRPEAHFAMPGG
ncbi:MAG: hypothetical protein U0414_17430 [Polyangiaceae bacterium]